jgi:hypothetical protein
MEVVNDSGQPDSNVYVMMSGSQFQVVNGGMPFIDLANNPTATVNSVPLTNLSTNGFSVVSPLSGRTNTIYAFNMVMGKSCRMFVAYNSALQFLSGAAPTNIEPYRFDKFEFDFTSAPTWAGNLTSVDFVGIPMHLEAVDTATGEPFDGRTFYLSQKTMVKQMASLISRFSGPTSVNKVIQRDSSNGFLRILSPATITGNNVSSAPYPSYSAYLKALAYTNYTFNTSHIGQGFGASAPTYVDDNTNTVTINIPTYTANYSYNGVVSTNGMDGYVINLTGSVTWDSGNMPAVYPGGTGTNAYSATTAFCTNLAVYLPKKLLDDNLYGCPTTMNAFNVFSPSLSFPTNCTQLSSQSNYFNAVMGNSVYSYILANVQSAINLGYFGGIYGTNTTVWYDTVLPPSFPFGGARKPNDGFYNPYAAMVYGFSDSYGFAYSDRVKVGTNPLISYDSSDTTFRVTILPDNVMDSPQVTATPSGTNSVNLSWSAVGNIPAGYNPSYLIDAYPPLPGGPVSVTGTSTNISGLASGMPYAFSVTAQAVSPDLTETNFSFAIPVNALTQGSYVPPPSSTYTNLISPASWAAGVFSNPANYPITIAGQATSFTPGVPPASGTYTPATVSGIAGTNYYPVIVTDGEGDVLYQNAITFEMTAGPLITDTHVTNSPSFNVPVLPEMPGMSLPMTFAAPFGVALPGPFPILTGGAPGNPNPPTLSFAGAPESSKQVSAVLFPNPEAYKAPGPKRFKQLKKLKGKN